MKKDIIEIDFSLKPKEEQVEDYIKNIIDFPNSDGLCNDALAEIGFNLMFIERTKQYVLKFDKIVPPSDYKLNTEMIFALARIGLKVVCHIQNNEEFLILEKV